jgi:hypothetical protein
LNRVNPPTLQKYICFVKSRLRGNGRFWGLDKFSADEFFVKSAPCD